jgi:hypothetical protein
MTRPLTDLDRQRASLAIEILTAAEISDTLDDDAPWKLAFAALWAYAQALPDPAGELIDILQVLVVINQACLTPESVERRRELAGRVG